MLDRWSPIPRGEATASLPDSVLVDERTVENQIPRWESDNEKDIGDGELGCSAESRAVAIAVREGVLCILDPLASKS